jgi:cation transport ATPase
VLIGNYLLNFTKTLEVARWTRIIGWNFVDKIGINLLRMALAEGGPLNPKFAAFIHEISECTLILKSAQLLPTAQGAAAADTPAAQIFLGNEGDLSRKMRPISLVFLK